MDLIDDAVGDLQLGSMGRIRRVGTQEPELPVIEVGGHSSDAPDGQEGLPSRQDELALIGNPLLLNRHSQN